jgi:hypothetical protein
VQVKSTEEERGEGACGEVSALRRVKRADRGRTKSESEQPRTHALRKVQTIGQEVAQLLTLDRAVVIHGLPEIDELDPARSPSASDLPARLGVPGRVGLASVRLEPSDALGRGPNLALRDRRGDEHLGHRGREQVEDLTELGRVLVERHVLGAEQGCVVGTQEQRAEGDSLVTLGVL